MTTEPLKTWRNADPGEVHKFVHDHVSRMESDQSDMYDRFVKLEALYDPNGWAATNTDVRAEMMGSCENGIASNVDTVTASVATSDVRARFMTDGADWSRQRQARHVEWYIEGLAKQLGRAPKCRMAFTSSAKKGTGLVHVDVDMFDQIQVEHVRVDDIVVPPRKRNPREMHRRMIVDADDLVAEFPEHEDKIMSARGASDGLWAGYRPVEENEVVVLESWSLPFGKKGHANKKYRAGRHAKTIEGVDLLDEEYHKPFFPPAEIRWTERDEDWHGISGAERIAGSQRTLNRRNIHIERGNDQNAFPTTWVRTADAGIAIKTVNRLGSVAVYKSDLPVTQFAPAVSNETYQSRRDLKESMNNEFGHSSMSTHGAQPAGLESGEAVRQWRETTEVRFATQEKSFEQLNLDTDILILDKCKDLGAKAPVILRQTRFGTKEIKWGKVNIDDLRMQIQAASTLPRTPAGRSQLITEWAQAGVISTDEFRRLSGHPDLEKELSLYTAAIEAIEECIEEIAEGGVVVPEPYDNLKLAAYRAQQTYLIWRKIPKVPQEVLENLRQYIVIALHMEKMKAGPAANANAGAPPMPGEMPMDPAMAGADPGMMPPEMGAPMPTGPAPVAALAPQAMQLRAG